MSSITTNIASHLPAMAVEHPGTPAVIIQRADRNGYHYETCTLRELNDESDAFACGFERIGVASGTRTVLMVSPSRAFFALTFALFKVGAVPVLVDPGMGVKNLKKCLDEAEPQAFIGITKAHVARMVLGWAKTAKVHVTVGPRLFWGGHRYDDLRKGNGAEYSMASPSPDDTAAILFTSGGTGAPKGAVYTHGMFNAQVDLLKQIYAIQPGEKDIATFPLFALFGPALAMAAIVPDMDASRPAKADPRHIIAAIQDHGATNMFGSPALIKNVGRYGLEHNVSLPTLRRVISAGAPADTQALEDFATMLAPGVEIFTPYGATEALPVASIGTAEILGETAARTAEGAGTCVGTPVVPGSVTIIRITDDAISDWSDDLVLPSGETGEIVVRSPVVSRSYFNRPESTALAKIAGPNGAIYHRMGDVGYFDDRGRLWFCGRKVHRVETSEGTLFTIPCERVFNTHLAVNRTALVGVSRNGATVPVLCVELKPETSTPRDQIVKDLGQIAQEHPHTQSIQHFLFHPDFPVDIRHNAKIFREKLAAWAAKRL
jgi:olefin beta-lactone synthetase